MGSSPTHSLVTAGVTVCQSAATKALKGGVCVCICVCMSLLLSPSLSLCVCVCVRVRVCVCVCVRECHAHTGSLSGVFCGTTWHSVCFSHSTPPKRRYLRNQAGNERLSWCNNVVTCHHFTLALLTLVLSRASVPRLPFTSTTQSPL